MIELVIDETQWNEALTDASAVAEQALAAATALEPAVQGEIAILLASDTKMRHLNAEFRGKHAPTNVLAFPGDENGFLGDIALGFETCRREADAAGRSLRDHATWLIVHGILHLIGYDHQTDEQAVVMEARESEILRSMGIADPYAELETT
ncbi:MAG: rRNA maturation RNase YbeY [Pseudomonadota bacterium]